MDWNPLTWTFATTFFGISLLKWGIVVGTIIFLALLRKFILGTRSTTPPSAMKSIDAGIMPAPPQTNETIASTPSIATANEATSMKETIPVKASTKKNIAKIKSFKRAVVVAKAVVKKKRKAKKMILPKQEDALPAAPPSPAPVVAPIVSAKAESAIVQPVRTATSATKKPVATIKKKPVAKKAKKKAVKVNEISDAPTANETDKAVSTKPVTEKKTETPQTKAPVIIAERTSNTAPTKQAAVKKIENKEAAETKTISVPKKKLVAKATTAVKSSAPQTKSDAAQTENKTPAPTGKPIRARNPGFI